MKGISNCKICNETKDVEMLIFNDEGTLLTIRMKCGHQRYFKIEEIAS